MASNTHLQVSKHRPVMAVLSIQPNIPQHMLLRPTQSLVPTVSDGVAQKNVLHQNQKSFAVKKFRMRSLLWVKPTGVAESSLLSTVAQLIPTLVVNLSALSSGLALGFSAVAIPHLREHSNSTVTPILDYYQPFTIGQQAGTWIASILGLGAVFGGLVSGTLGSKYGRRRTIQFLALVDLLGWVLIGTAQNLIMMLLGRFLSGFAMAGYIPSIQVFVAEMAQPQHRMWLCGLTLPVLALGSLLAFVIGSTTSWFYVAIVGVCLPLFVVHTLRFVHDTPYWCLLQGDDKKAVQMMEKFRAPDANGLSELMAISDTLKPENTETSLRECLKELVHGQHLKPFLILNFLILLMVFSGSFTIDFYTVDIFRVASSSVNAYSSTMILGAVKLLGAILFVPIVEHCSRKLHLCVSSLIMGLSLLAFALANYYRGSGGAMGATFEGLYWLPLLCLSVFVVANVVGLGSIPFLFMGEFFPLELRSAVSGILVSIFSFEVFIILQTFPVSTLLMGSCGPFWLYAGTCFVAAIFTLVCIPETRGRSFLDIERHFGSKSIFTISTFARPKDLYPQSQML